MSEWINIKDRLPYDFECVLVIGDYAHTSGQLNIISVIYHETSNIEERWEVDHFCESSYLRDIKYWMPLPEPPR